MNGAIGVMACVVSLKRNGAGWAVRLVRGNNPERQAIVERLGFSWRPDVGLLGAYTTDDVAVALALLDLKAVSVVPDIGVVEQIRKAAATISVTEEITRTVAVADAISVTADVAQIPRVEMEAPALDPAYTMDAITATVGVTEKFPAGDAIAVTADDTEIPMKRKRGRPPKAEGAMTVAERARRYRRKHVPAWQNRRVDLASGTFKRAEKLVEQTGFSIDEVIYYALGEASPEFWNEMQAARIRLDEEREQRLKQRQAQAAAS